FGFAENTDDLFVGKTLLHGDVLMWLMKTLLTSGCTNQRGAGQFESKCAVHSTSLYEVCFDNYLNAVKGLSDLIISGINPHGYCSLVGLC
ncbi:hypothetical protein N8Q21_25540, partial [Enterobacter hormaechei subsp. xiangfangensis]|nr:hypothetical protein [Enterobacter hormaechei subsp. xiangfangensis]MCU2999083.1 hypothetical protein [Enterobacter hormaechei subsp. xiangfangensis]